MPPGAILEAFDLLTREKLGAWPFMLWGPYVCSPQLGAIVQGTSYGVTVRDPAGKPATLQQGDFPGRVLLRATMADGRQEWRLLARNVCNCNWQLAQKYRRKPESLWCNRSVHASAYVTPWPADVLPEGKVPDGA